jgi:hypothetical protein
VAEDEDLQRGLLVSIHTAGLKHSIPTTLLKLIKERTHTPCMEDADKDPANLYENLNTEHIKSHLQKYRLRARRLPDIILEVLEIAPPMPEPFPVPSCVAMGMASGASALSPAPALSTASLSMLSMLSFPSAIPYQPYQSSCSTSASTAQSGHFQRRQIGLKIGITAASQATAAAAAAAAAPVHNTGQQQQKHGVIAPLPTRMSSSDTSVENVDNVDNGLEDYGWYVEPGIRSAPAALGAANATVGASVGASVGGAAAAAAAASPSHTTTDRVVTVDPGQRWATIPGDLGGGLGSGGLEMSAQDDLMDWAGLLDLDTLITHPEDRAKGAAGAPGAPGAPGGSSGSNRSHGSVSLPRKRSLSVSSAPPPASAPAPAPASASASASATASDVDDAAHEGTGLTKKPPAKKRKVLGKDAVAMLKAWMFSAEHIEHPYPEEEEKQRLAELAGVTKKQLANWFTNARSRLWLPMMRARASRNDWDVVNQFDDCFS